jgi:Tol biopolymer transport system component
VIAPSHQAPLRISFNLSQDESPLWSHDGRQILWLSDRDGRNGFYIKDSDGTTIKEVSLMPLGVDLSFASAPSDWSPDGHFLLYTDLQETNALHLWVFPMIGDRKPYRFLSGPAADLEGQFSPDGNWVAYSSNESGRWEVYVASFPGSYAKYQVSTAGGQQPRWRRDGRELFFIAPDRNLMASSVKPGATLQFNRPVSLFQTSSHEPITAEEFFTYDVSADGERFLVNVDAEQPGPHTVDIVFNWVSMLKH